MCFMSTDPVLLIVHIWSWWRFFLWCRELQHKNRATMIYAWPKWGLVHTYVLKCEWKYVNTVGDVGTVYWIYYCDLRAVSYTGKKIRKTNINAWPHQYLCCRDCSKSLQLSLLQIFIEEFRRWIFFIGFSKILVKEGSSKSYSKKLVEEVSSRS
jgi:hypothetical protein